MDIRPLRQPAFAALWGASLVASVAAMMQSVGLAWYLISIDDSPLLITTLQTAATLPIIFLSFIAGAIADSVDRRIIMATSQGVLLVLAIVLAAAAALSWRAPWLILAVSAASGAALAFYGPAAQAALMSLVHRDLVAPAVNLGSISFNMARTLGPALGGLVVATLGPAAAIGAGAVGALALLLVILAFWRPAKNVQLLPPEPLLEGVHTGARFIALSPELSGALLRTGVFGMCAGVVLSFPPLVAHHLLDGGPQTLGFLLAAFGVGAIVSAFLGSRLRAHFSPKDSTQWSGLAVAASLALIGANSHPSVTLVAFALAGFAWVAFLTPLTIGIQLHAPEWMAGRAVAAFQITLAAGLAVGGPLWGGLAEYGGVGAALLTASGALASLLLLLRYAPITPGVVRDSAPLYDRQTILPEASAPVAAGKIIVMVAYRVPVLKATAFQEAARALGRIRTRDGARRWRLMQDLSDPEVWIERFESLNWIEHLRRILRPTQEDGAVRDRVYAFSTTTVRITRFLDQTG